MHVDVQQTYLPPSSRSIVCTLTISFLSFASSFSPGYRLHPSPRNPFTPSLYTAFLFRVYQNRPGFASSGVNPVFVSHECQPCTRRGTRTSLSVKRALLNPNCVHESVQSGNAKWMRTLNKLESWINTRESAPTSRLENVRSSSATLPLPPPLLP